MNIFRAENMLNTIVSSFKICVFMTLLFNPTFCNTQSIDPITIIIGEDASANPSVVGWTDGVCYKPITSGVHPGDSLEFRYYAHDVHLMASKEHFLACDFTDATLLAKVGEAPFRYKIPNNQAGTLYFACNVGNHCASGTQKLQVMVSPLSGDIGQDRPATISSYLVGTSRDDCQKLQESPNDEAISDKQALDSECSEPILGDNGYFTRTCLSGPATLTPGGVINRLFVMQYPFPKDHRVAIGQRTFEFVYDNIDGEGVTLAPLNQLYVHHLSGNLVFGQGAEGLKQTAPDAPFADPYVLMSGDEADSMIFHIIDLREVDDWLPCIECRCPVSNMTYMDSLVDSGNLTGGVDCCSNCTDLAGPTLDYRMRYNISYRELDDEIPVENVDFLIADISPAVGKVLEHDVPSWQYLPDDQKKKVEPYVQYLERVMPFNKLFKEGFFERDFSGTGEVELIRCVAHLHVAAIDSWVEDVETGERICDGQTTYGTDPESDKDFLIAVSVDNHNPPLTFAVDRMVRFVTRYDAKQVHTGVMGYWFVFIGGKNYLTSEQTDLTVDLCLQPTCDASMLPSIDMRPFVPPLNENVAIIDLRTADTRNNNDCTDTLAQHPACIFGRICECEELVNSPLSDGCDGFYNSPFGDLEVRSVCDKFCGCDVTAAIEDAVQEEKVTPSPVSDTPTPIPTRTSFLPVSVSSAPAKVPIDEDEVEKECTDTLAQSPACTFGGLCDCKVFVNAPESSGCNGEYTSQFGNIEIRSVCAKYCGCGEGRENSSLVPDTSTSIPTSPAPSKSSTSANETEEDCKDTLAESPACTFGGLCDCDVFVNAPESSGCDGEYASQFGSIVIRSVCANYCGCEGEGNETGEIQEPVAPPVSSSNRPSPVVGSNCVDTLSKSPVCKFGQICSCEEFVNAPESEGCGGLYVSFRGNIVVNDVCARYCNVCEEESLEERFEKAYMEVLTIQAKQKCRFSTAECRAMLLNMYACGSGQLGIEQADPMIQAVVTKQGEKVTLDSAKLGHPSLHVGGETQEVQFCTSEMDENSSGDSSEDSSEDSSAAVGQATSFWIAVIIITASTTNLPLFL